jgi:type II secretory pathway component HofQ
MRKIVSGVCALALAAWAGTALTATAAPTPKDTPRPRAETGAEFVKKVLDAKTNLEFNGITLEAALAQLSDEHRINLVLDKAALQNMGFEPNDMMVAVKLKDVKLRNGLRTMLGQYNLTVAIVGESALVTTEEQAIYKQLKQRINVDLDNVPLSKALKDLAQSYALNIVLDPRTVKTKAADAPVTLSVDDVPFEAAVRLMCEMANLKPARMGNVIFITTEDRADKLKDSDSLVPTPGLPIGPGIPGTVPGGPGIVPLGGAGGAIPPPLPVEEKKARDKDE